MAQASDDAVTARPPDIDLTTTGSSRATGNPDEITIVDDIVVDDTVVDDISIVPDPEQKSTFSKLLWALPVLPWLWYVVRSLFAAMDLVAIGLPVLAIVTAAAALAIAVLRRSPQFFVLALSTAVFFWVAVLLPFGSTNGPAPIRSIRVATVNTGLYWFSDNDLGFLVFDEEPDLVVGVELAESHDAELSSRFENSIASILPLERQQANEIALAPTDDTFRRNGLPSIGVYANLEMLQLDDPLDGVIPGGMPGFRIQVSTDSGDMILYALHIPRPIDRDGVYEVSAGEHVAIAEAVADAVEAETLPTMILGDLNAVDRGQAYRALTGTLNDGIRHAGNAGPTTDRDFFEELLFARLDHLLISPDLCTENAESIDTQFSDHRPQVIDVGPCE